MSTFSGSGVITANIQQASNSNSTGTLSSSFQSVSSTGTVAIVQQTSNAQLTLSTATGKLTVPAPKIPLLLESGKAISFKLNPDTSANLLDISAKYLKQRIALTPQQSQMLLQQITQNPANIATPVEVKANVVAIQASSIQVSVNSETLKLPVKSPQRYTLQEVLKLQVNAGTLGWEARINAGATQESLRVSPEDVAKILQQVTPNKTLELSSNGRQAVHPLLNKLTESQLPESIPRIQVRNQEDRLLVQLDFGTKPLATIPLEKAQMNQLRQLMQNLQTLTDTPSMERATQAKVTANTLSSANPVSDKRQAMTYKMPHDRQAQPVSPDIDKTIAESQKQFTQLNVNKVIPEIKISEQKHQQTQSVKSAPEPNSDNDVKAPKLSNAAQQILQTLKTLQSSSMPNMQELVLKNIEKLMVSLSTSRESSQPPSSPTSTIKPEVISAALRSQANQVLNTIRGLSEQVTNSSETQLQKLAPAVDEILKSLNVNEELKHFVRKQVSSSGTDVNKAATSLPDMQSIRQLLQSPALPITPVSIISPPAGGMVAGLINLLQVSLAARLSRNNNELTEKIANNISNIVAGSGKQSTAGKTPGTGVKDLSQIDQKHNLVKLLGDLVNHHSKQKLQNAERTLQGQEAFYYVLPFRQSEQHASPEILITRDKPEEQDKHNKTTDNKAWLLTMKLPVGDLGELLTKTKVNDDAIKVDFYASNDSLKDTVMEYLPSLKKRFDTLGLNLEIGRCERGHIPEQLAQNPYQILQTRA